MPAVNLSPVFNGWQGFTPSGLPLTNGLLQTYQAGTSTPLQTYTTSAGNIANANPTQLLADGRPPNEIWLDAAYSYKFVLMDSLSNIIGTYDNITGIDNTIPAALSEWVVSGLTPSYVSATQFTLAGNQTSLFEIGRRIRYTLGAGQYTGSITNSVFGAVTTVTVATDSVPLDASLSAVDYGFLDALKPSVPSAFKSQLSAPTLSIPGVSTLTGGAVFAGGAGNLNWFEDTTFFTPGVAFGGASVGVGYNANTRGSYTRVGKRVFFELRMKLSNKGASVGNVSITGLPYPGAGTGVVTAYVFSVLADAMVGMTAAPVIGIGAAFSTSIGLYQQTATTFTALTDANFSNTSDVIISGSYRTD